MMTKRKRRVSVLAAVLVGGVCIPKIALAWGHTGHAVVADIAEAHLTPAAREQVKQLLAVDHVHHLWEISEWADEAKSEGLEGSPSHTIRLPIDGKAPAEHPCPGHFCADDAITRYSAVLTDSTQSAQDREIALKYIVHLVGDLHQPLHGTNATGSGVQVVFQGKQMNLHVVWDSGIIEAHSRDHADLAKELMHTEEGHVPTNGGPVDWAHEDLVIAQQQIYNTIPLHPDRPVLLPLNYGKTEWPVVAARLTEGGLRLSELLNQLLK
jgi:hypothetical protein